MKRLFSFVFFALSMNLCAASQTPPNTPQIEPEQKSESPANPKEISKNSAKQSGNLSAALPHVLPLIQTIPSKPEGENGSEEGTEFWPSFFGYRVKITDSLLVAFTFLLWFATRRLVVGAEDTSKRQLRAYLSAVPFHISRFDETTPIQIRYNIINHGQTPACKVTQKSIVVFLPSFIPSNFSIDSFPEFDKIQAVVHHGTKGIHGIANAAFPCTKSQLEGIVKDGSIRIYVFGIVRYSDVFDVIHETKFGFSVAHSDHLAIIAKGNTTDCRTDFETTEQHNDIS